MRKTISFSFSVEDGDLIKEYLAVCDVSYHIDESWGADADGNRGENRTIIDDVDIVYIIDGSGNNVPNYRQSLKETVKEQAGDHL